MSKTAVITTRVDPELKSSAEQVLEQLGMTTAQAITMFLKQVELNQGLPFTPKLPPAEQQDAMLANKRPSIMRYAGLGQCRTYKTAQEADRFIAELRDEWER